jgi:nitrogen regulatory protein PII 2
MDMVNKTKEALLKEGFPSITCRKVMGRGKKKVAYELFQDVFTGNEGLTPIIAEQLSEEHRLMPKRMLVIAVNDEEVKNVVDTIIKVNQNGNPGNGRIFVSTLEAVIRVRTGETGIEAI